MSSWLNRLNDGLSKSRQRLSSALSSIVGSTLELDDDFYDSLEEILISSDMGIEASTSIVEEIRSHVRAGLFSDIDGFYEGLESLVAKEFETSGDPLQFSPVTIMMVGINGTGKTTSVGKIAHEAVGQGKKVVLGSADTFRAAALEQLGVWAKRAGVEVVEKERGADPAAVAFETLERAKEMKADLCLIDTAGRLHSEINLMKELEKVARVVKDHANMPVFTVLVMDATTGQNGLVQAREFNKHLALDALIITKLDGTAKGGIAVAISRELKIPIIRIGVGEGIEDLQVFNPKEFARALVGRSLENE